MSTEVELPVVNVIEVQDSGSGSSISSYNEYLYAAETTTRRTADFAYYHKAVEAELDGGSKTHGRTPSLGRGSEMSYESDASWVSRVSALSTEEIKRVHNEIGLASSNGDPRSVAKSKKKKKTVRKLVRTMLKKTFSDADATPDAEWNIDWRNVSSRQLHPSEYNRSTPKIKRKLHKRAPFTAEVGISFSNELRSQTRHSRFLTKSLLNIMSD